MSNGMRFRDELLMRLLTNDPMRMLDAMTVAGLVRAADTVAKEACKQWGHDGFEYVASAPGAATIANPMVEHRHYYCRRCGQEIKS